MLLALLLVGNLANASCDAIYGPKPCRKLEIASARKMFFFWGQCEMDLMDIESKEIWPIILDKCLDFKGARYMKIDFACNDMHRLFGPYVPDKIEFLSDLECEPKKTQ